jgi:hypothetical protein
MDTTTVIRLVAGILFVIGLVYFDPAPPQSGKVAAVAAALFDDAWNSQGRDSVKECMLERRRVGGAKQYSGATTMRRTLCVFNRTRESFLGLRVAPADTWRMGLKALSEKWSDTRRWHLADSFPWRPHDRHALCHRLDLPGFGEPRAFISSSILGRSVSRPSKASVPACWRCVRGPFTPPIHRSAMNYSFALRNK